MKDNAPVNPQDAIRRLLVRYIQRARQRVKNQKPKERKPVRLVLPSKSGVPAWSLAFGGTLFASVFLLVASSLPVMAVELVNPHAVLERTRRDLMEFDKRMQRYKAERQKEEKELQARQKREEAERREREKAEKALAEARRKRDAAEQQKRMRAEKEQQARQKQEQAERQKAEALQEAEREEEAEREKTKEALQESERQRDAAAKATESQERGTASKQAEAEGEKTKEESKPREGLRGMLSNRVDRRSACRQQAEERGLTGRKASRYTRLCVSGLPIPKTLSR